MYTTSNPGPILEISEVSERDGAVGALIICLLFLTLLLLPHLCSLDLKASILASGRVVRTPRWAFLGLTLLRIGPRSS